MHSTSRFWVFWERARKTSFAEVRNRVNRLRSLPPRVKEKLFYATVIVLVGLLAFAVGRLSVIYGGEGEFKVVYPGSPSASAGHDVPGILHA
jgi:hypothetical protein